MEVQIGTTACLLDHGAHINQGDNQGRTACHAACERGHLSVLNLLLEKGANPSIPHTGGWTPLMVASAHGHESLADLLLQHPQARGAINHRRHKSPTALGLACWRGLGGLVRRLLEAGADPTIAPNDTDSPMGLARHQGKEDCVMLLEVRERKRGGWLG